MEDPNTKKRKFEKIAKYPRSLGLKHCNILGEGSNGTVYKIANKQWTDCTDAKFLACKRFKVEDDDELTLTSPIIREIFHLKMLGNHDNIIKMLYVNLLDQPIMVIEYLEMDLAKFIDLHKECPDVRSKNAILVAYQIMSALDYMHENNYAHRDVKPTNIVCALKGNQIETCKLIDFGLAKLMPDKEINNYSEHNNIVTITFRAPELLIPITTHKIYQYYIYNVPIDVWALGVTLLQMIIGYNPLDTSSNDNIDSNQILKNIADIVNIRLSPHYIQSHLPQPNFESIEITESQPIFLSQIKSIGIKSFIKGHFPKEIEYPELIDLIKSCLHPDPEKRITCKSALSLSLFNAFKPTNFQIIVPKHCILDVRRWWKKKPKGNYFTKVDRKNVFKFILKICKEEETYHITLWQALLMTDLYVTNYKYPNMVDGLFDLYNIAIASVYISSCLYDTCPVSLQYTFDTLENLMQEYKTMDLFDFYITIMEDCEKILTLLDYTLPPLTLNINYGFETSNLDSIYKQYKKQQVDD